MRNPTRALSLVVRIFVRLLREQPDVVQGDLAGALRCDRTRIAHILAGRQVLPADELDVWCDVLDTIEPLDAIARRIGHHVVPLEREASPATLERAGWGLMASVSAFGSTLGEALGNDGKIDAVERAALRRQLLQAREQIEGMLARLPEVGA